MQSILSRFLMMFSLLVVSSTLAFPQEEKPKDAYQAAWDDISELLRRREYGSAIAKLDALAEERDLRDYGKQIEADKKAIDGLQVLERVVLEQAAKLEAETSIEVSGIGYTVVRYEKSSKGDALVLKSKSLERETRKLVADLPSGTWVELAEADLTPLNNAPLTLGIFLAFDRIADRKAARKLLNEAALHGEDVTPWLARLGVAEKKLPVAGEKEDPIIGQWSGRFGSIDHAIAATYEFRKSGTGVMKIDSRLLAIWKAPPGQGPKEWEVKKALLRRAQAFEWQRKADGSYKLTFKLGGATFDGFVLDGDTLTLPGYHPFTRPAKK